MKAETSLKEKKIQVMLFKKDGFSFTMALLAIAMEFIYVVNILDAMSISWILGVTVLGNIFMLFLLFTCAVKINVYEKIWSCITFLTGIYFLVRQFVLVPYILRPYENRTAILVVDLLGAALLLTAGAVSFRNTVRRKALREKLDKSGN